MTNRYLIMVIETQKQLSAKAFVVDYERKQRRRLDTNLLID